MAQAWMNHFCGNGVDAHSAGIEPGTLNPLVVEAMRESGIDISGNSTQSVDNLLKCQQSFDLVITVCDEASAQRCPVFPGKAQRLHWGFPDPSALTGTREEKLSKVREIRDAIKTKVEQWCKQYCPG